MVKGVFLPGYINMASCVRTRTLGDKRLESKQLQLPDLSSVCKLIYLVTLLYLTKPFYVLSV